MSNFKSLLLIGILSSMLITSTAFLNIVPDWENSFGSANEEYLCFSIESSDGGILLAGSTNQYDLHDQDILLIKLNSDFEEQWRLNIDEYWDETCTHAIETARGNFYVVNSTRDRSCLLKINNQGELHWVRSVFDESDNQFARIFELHDASILVVNVSGRRPEYLSCKIIDANGNITIERELPDILQISELILNENENIVSVCYIRDQEGIRLIELTLEGQIVHNQRINEIVSSDFGL